MVQFYVQRSDEEHCRNSVITQQPVTVAGLTFNSTVQVFTGVVRSVENVPAAQNYPVRVTMAD